MTKTGDLFAELAAVPPPAEDEQDERQESELRAERDDVPEGRRADRRWLAAGLLLGAVVFFAGSVWYAFKAGQRTGVQIVVPVIKAESGPAKQKPENPGGINPPHQDKLIFDRVAPGQAEDREERLRPEPEKPLESAMAPPPAPAAEAPAGPAPTPLHPAPGEPTAAETAPDGAEVAAVEPAEGPPPVWSAPPAAAAPAGTARAQAMPGDTTEPKAVAEAEPPQEPSPNTDDVPEQLALIEPAAGTSAPGGTYRVQIAAFRTEERADLAWDSMLRRHRDILGAVGHVIERADLGADRGVYYRVQIGPFRDKAAASDLCAKLRAREASCIVVKGS